MASIKDICHETIKVQNFTGSSSCLCIDGTSGCFKTTILQRLKEKNYVVTKVQQQHTIINPNTFSLSTLGYLTTGLINQYMYEGVQFSDRSFLNPLQWSFLWKFMDAYKCQFGNTYVNMKEPEMKKFINNFQEKTVAFRNNIIYQNFNKEINCIAIINTDYHKVDSIRRVRGIGSDMERCDWKFYTFLQNEFYKCLYPNSYIDLNDLCFESDDIIIAELANFFEYVGKELRNNCSMEIRKKLREINFKIPATELHYSTLNMKTHIYRSKLRAQRNAIVYNTNQTQLNDNLI